ncbi:MAG: energy-coupling factor ABC transporter ATP-binding protein [Thaumarchaeota archaeon]|nr:energy-coupling factor ABC transporter ATP-binding protein [Candidatus Calditenuaceae archaeon]MDW8041991.1 ABC transporter ATP-binding protein [Nitrososphaerota archaeon]
MLEAVNVSYVYPSGKVALDDVNLAVRDGEVMVLMGSNGAGKTTLLKTLVGLLRPKSGKVLLDGMEVSSMPVREVSRMIGYVPQIADSLFFLESVWEEMTYALRNFGIGDADHRVESLLERFGLDGLKDRSPFSLSGGQKKRLSIAVVLAWDPKYVLLDEPTLGQDKSGREAIAWTIESLRKEGRGVVIATHDVEFASELDPRVTLLSSGRVLASGTAAEVLSDEELLRSANLLPPQSVVISKQLGRLGVQTTHRVDELVSSIASVMRCKGFGRKHR